MKLDVPSGRAISIRQPFVEDILRGKKKFEFRSRKTHIRGRVFLYASNKDGDEEYWKRIKLRKGTLPKGAILGSVEIVGYRLIGGRYAYKLINPKRYKRSIPVKNKPQPCFFFPFKMEKKTP